MHMGPWHRQVHAWDRLDSRGVARAVCWPGGAWRQQISMVPLVRGRSFVSRRCRPRRLRGPGVDRPKGGASVSAWPLPPGLFRPPYLRSRRDSGQPFRCSSLASCPQPRPPQWPPRCLSPSTSWPGQEGAGPHCDTRLGRRSPSARSSRTPSKRAPTRARTSSSSRPHVGGGPLMARRGRPPSTRFSTRPLPGARF